MGKGLSATKKYGSKTTNHSQLARLFELHVKQTQRNIACYRLIFFSSVKCHSYHSILWGCQFHYFKTVKLKISCRSKSQLFVSRHVVTNQCCGLSVIFCGFVWHLIGCKTINIPEHFSGVHAVTGKTVNSGIVTLIAQLKYQLGASNVQNKCWVSKKLSEKWLNTERNPSR